MSRAKHCLENNRIESLFHAAFELRCGIEARMREYLEVQAHISKKKREGWQVAKLARNIEDAFRIGEKEAVLRVRDSKSNEVLLEARYTPVKKSLRRKAEKLGDVLHAAKKYHSADSEYWTNLRNILEITAEDLQPANSGRLLGPLLIHPNKKGIEMKLELPTPEEQEAAKRLAVDVEAILEVSYE